MAEGNKSGGIANRHLRRSGDGDGESQGLVLAVFGEARGERWRAADIRESLKTKGGHRFFQPRAGQGAVRWLVAGQANRGHGYWVEVERRRGAVEQLPQGW